jgi:enoyl-CoA hydratase/carnithine racemase
MTGKKPNSSEVLLSREGHTAAIKLNRPDQRNCLSLSVLQALGRIIDEIGDDASVRVVILESGGPAFCSGHDLKELSAARENTDGGRAFYAETMETCSAVMQRIVHCPKPVIASIQGIATAAGCQLVASCDLAVAADVARFATPGVNIGLFCSTPMVALSRNLARKRAMEMLLTGTMIDAQTACSWGLVNRVVPASELQEATRSLAAQIGSKSAATIRVGKEAFYRQREMPLDEAYSYTSRVMVENMLHKDAEEGIGAFLEKREPVWSHG